MTTLSSKGKLQVLHIALLILVPTLYALIKINSEPQDYFPQLLGNTLIVIGSVWGGYVIAMTLKHGSKENVIKRLQDEYTRLLNNLRFLYVSSTLLTMVAGILLYQLICYRQVEFISTSDVRLVLNDTVGKPELLGVIKEKQPTKFRLRIGKGYLAYTRLTSDSPVALEPLEVTPWWSSKDLRPVRIEVAEQTYERISN